MSTEHKTSITSEATATVITPAAKAALASLSKKVYRLYR
jgi:hypothetical protein